MIWLAIGLLALAALAPLGVALLRRGQAQGARELAMQLHQTQLAELDRDLAENRILPAEHATAKLEVQRRLLAAAAASEAVPRTGSRTPLLVTAALVPVLALGLYLVGGTPGMPSVTNEAAVARKRAAEGDALLAQLRQRLAAMDPKTEQARQGYVLLGTIEDQRGNPAAAAQAWTVALAARFDPTLAVRTAFAAAQAEGSLTTDSAALLRRALAAAPPDAPWRGVVEEQLKQAGL